MPLNAHSVPSSASLANGASSCFSIRFGDLRVRGRLCIAGIFRTITLVLLLGAAACTRAVDELPAADFKQTIPEIASCEQMILVTTKSWEATEGTLWCFERADPAAPWTAALPSTTVVVGQKGMAWGIGRHGAHPGTGPIKQEGDHCAPAGVFSLVVIFGYADRAEADLSRFPYRPLTEATKGVDDPESSYYNRIVEAPPRETDWTSAETMRRQDELYRWGIFVRHNWDQEWNRGSCIFMHIWREPGHPTVGCTAMPEEQITKVIRWLDEKKNPLLVQLPEAEYVRWRESWSLPVTTLAQP
jgi:D-alanyl-D-alanine dipeptidase